MKQPRPTDRQQSEAWTPFARQGQETQTSGQPGADTPLSGPAQSFSPVQKGMPGQDALSNQGPWAKIADTTSQQQTQPVQDKTGANYSESVPGRTGLFSNPQKDPVGIQPERMFRDFAPSGPGQGAQQQQPGGKATPASPYENSPAFRGANVARFLGNPLQMNRTDIPLTESLAGTRQPGRFPMMPSKQRQVGVNEVSGAAPMPTSYPAVRRPKAYSVRGSVP
jgi:hypothetical protein